MIKDNIKNYLTYKDLSENIKLGLKYLAETDFNTLADGNYEIKGEDVYAIVQSYTTKPEGKLEAHRLYVDIQYLISGEEKIGHALLANQQIATDYVKDIIFYEGSPQAYITLKEGEFAVLAPADLHAPCLTLKTPCEVRKVVVKCAL